MPLIYRSRGRIAALALLAVLFVVVALVLFLATDRPETGPYVLMAAAICLFQIGHERRLPRRPKQ